MILTIVIMKITIITMTLMTMKMLAGSSIVPAHKWQGCLFGLQGKVSLFSVSFFLHFLYYEYWTIVHVWCIEAYPNNATNNPPGTCSCRPKARLATAAEISPTARTGSSKARTTRRSTRPTIRVSEEISVVWKHSPVSQLFPNVGFSPQGKKVKWAVMH